MLQRKANYTHVYNSLNKSVHVLVAEAFIGPCPENAELVRHLDSNKLNNDLSNVKWGSRADNYWDARKLGTAHVPSGGEDHPSSRLTAASVRDIHKLRKEGYTTKALGERFGVKSGSVNDILIGRTWHDIFIEITGLTPARLRRIPPPQD